MRQYLGRIRKGGSVVAVALVVGVAGVAQPGGMAAAAEKNATFAIEDKKIPAKDLIGMSVLTPNNEKIGEVVDLISRDNTYNDIVIRLDEENRQMGIVIGADNPRMAGKERPVVLGGSTIAVRAEVLAISDDGKGLTIPSSALTTVGEADALWSKRNKAK